MTGRVCIATVFLMFLTGAEECGHIDHIGRAKKTLGGDAVCTKSYSEESDEVICIKAGRRFSCITDSNKETACALTSQTPAEGR